MCAKLLLNIGMCFFTQHQWEESVVFFGEALRVDDQYLKAHYLRAKACMEMGQFREAL